ncbi:hypothetical protein Sste5346_005033 [Sporothrix stenoceras]|uniref:Uncharacterized protein n=1 Tax=Sporothrix stenoceras TaxID=5173 RepID=A0ABR3Z6M9_9PEZI
MSFSNAVTDLVRSIYEAIAGIFHLVFRVLHGAFSTVAHSFEAVINFVVDMVHSSVALVGGVGKFVAGNFVILAILAVGAYFYLQQSPEQKAQLKSSGKQALGSAKAQANAAGNRVASKSKKA